MHPLLEDGTVEQEGVARTSRCAFIGISNWALDPAKMNRGIFVQRGSLDNRELEKISRKGTIWLSIDVVNLYNIKLIWDSSTRATRSQKLLSYLHFTFKAVFIQLINNLVLLFQNRLKIYGIEIWICYIKRQAHITFNVGDFNCEDFRKRNRFGAIFGSFRKYPISYLPISSFQQNMSERSSADFQKT